MCLLYMANPFNKLLKRNMNFGVIGCGIIGLTTALELQKVYPNARVTILADQFNENTTSYVAAGIFRPGTSFSGPTTALTQQWINDAYNYWDEIRSSRDSALAGVCELSAYIFSSTSASIVRNKYIENLVPVYRAATEEELKLCSGNWKWGSFFTTCLTESRRFLPYASRKFIENGGIIMRQHVDKLTSLPDNYDIVFNCSGLGSRDLCNDDELVPIRGQVIKVKAPWIKVAFYGDYDTYIIPGFETVTLGGCRQYDSYNTEICKYDRLAIMERCCSLLPSLRNAPVDQELVGLRPHRSRVRVESELFTDTMGNRVKIIHNYGHGGYGVTTGPGTAKYAVKLATELLRQGSTISKL